MTAETIHTCSYACERPECIRAQRDELASRLTAAPPPAAARGDVRGLVEVQEGLCEPVQGTRFGHHPDPAIDFSVEVESLIAREFNARHGIGKPGSLPEPMWQVKAAIERAMQFRVGGDEGAKAAKASLRTLEAAIAAEGVQAEPKAEARGVVDVTDAMVERGVAEYRRMGFVYDVKQGVRKILIAALTETRNVR